MTLQPQAIEQHRQALYKYALRAVSDPDLAQDLVQDTFVAALSSGTAFRGDSSLRTWLVGILKHKITDTWRDRSRAMLSLDDVPADEDGAPSSIIDSLKVETEDPEYKLEQKRFWEQFRKLLERMPARTAQAFLLADLGGDSTDEICAKLGVSRNNLWVLRHRAKMFLRGALDPMPA
jgi:RNA polymerase sigma-70 factor (ECF subfamily)